MFSFTLKVPPDFENSFRLDQYVAFAKSEMNRSKLKACAQSILLNGKEAKLSAKIKPNDVIDVFWEENIPENIEPENIPLKIIYEDENVTVINKKQGVVTHPAAGNWNGTLVNALLFHWGKEAVPQLKEGRTNEILQKRRPGIVHRLDKDTSGVIITAKNRETEKYLGSQFKERLVQKDYVCIVSGRPPASSGDIQTCIARDPKNRQRFKAFDITGEEGKFARSIYHCIACFGNYSLMRVRIKTGRTHQIRVHMKYLGCPILGDKLYGSQSKLFPNATLMLHSRQMILKLQNETTYRRFKASIPERFFEVLHILKKTYPKEVLPKECKKCKAYR